MARTKSVAALKTHHSPIGLLQHWLAIEAIVDRWYETSKNQGNYTHIIHLITETIDLNDGQYMAILHSLIGEKTEKRLHLWGVVRDHMIPGRDTQANHRPKEEKGESNDVLRVHKVALKRVDRYRCEKEQKSPQKVAMDVDRLIVQVQETLKTLEVRIRFWSVFG